MDESYIEPPPIVAPPIAPREPGTVAVALDQDGRLAEDVACRHCGYNLRGLDLAGRCPECEMAIEKTLHGFLLRFSDPAWLKRLRSGLMLMIVTILLGNAWGVARAIIFIPDPSAIDPPSIAFGAVMLLPMAGLIIMHIVSYLFVTAPEPDSTLSSAVWSARRLARIGLISSGVIGLTRATLNRIIYMPLETELGEIQWLYGVMWGLSLLSMLAGFVGLFALFVYGRSLALRFPADSLAKRTCVVMWGYMISAIGSGILGVAIQAYLNSSYSSASWGIIDTAVTVQIVIGISVLGFGVWAIVLLFMYRHRLRHALALAEA